MKHDYFTGQHNPQGNDIVRTPTLPNHSPIFPERYYRRRSSLSVNDANISQTDGSISLEASPINRRRSSTTFLDPDDKEYLSRIHRHRSVSPALSNHSTSSTKSTSTCSCQSHTREAGSPHQADFGELKFSVQVRCINIVLGTSLYESY